MLLRFPYRKQGHDMSQVDGGMDAFLIMNLRCICAHESGHAIMALLKKIANEGIYFRKDTQQILNLVQRPQSNDLSADFYLFLAAGTAAERIVCGLLLETGDESDRKFFENAGAPDFEQTVTEAEAILLPQKSKIDSLQRTLKERFARIGKEEQNDSECYSLLSKQELEAELKRIGLPI